MFKRVLSLERKRSERSRQRFVLMLLHAGSLLRDDQGEAILGAITKAVFRAIRETDLPGWYEKDKVLGVICTEIGSGGMDSVLSALHLRVLTALRNDLSLEQMNAIHISFHVYPEDLDLENGRRSADISLYPDLKPLDKTTKGLAWDQESDRHFGQCLRDPAVVTGLSRDRGHDQANVQRANSLQAAKTGAVWNSFYVSEIPIDVLPERSEDSSGLRPAAYFREGEPGRSGQLGRNLQNKGRSSRDKGREISPKNQPGRASPILQCASR